MAPVLRPAKAVSAGSVEKSFSGKKRVHSSTRTGRKTKNRPKPLTKPIPPVWGSTVLDGTGAVVNLRP